MKIDLIELLASREIKHPSRIDSLKSNYRSDMTFEISGFPWWLNEPSSLIDAKITLHCENIVEFNLNGGLSLTDESDEDLEEFNAQPYQDILDERGENCDVYCYTACTNPLEYVVLLQERIRDLHWALPAEEYLNISHIRSSNNTTTSPISYQFGEAPETITKIICELLQERNMKYSIIKHSRDPSKLIYVTLGLNEIICERAYVTYDE